MYDSWKTKTPNISVSDKPNTTQQGSMTVSEMFESIINEMQTNGHPFLNRWERHNPQSIN